ncbi:MAG: exodeoxyribonuclease VII small subunit [Fidelibacterota bacterium]|nr:MAG: exodeoxyribonuclease VII small subunit [Candidatus Neomarinimicrobiota bacterium]
MAEKKLELTFEEALEQLNKIVTQLESEEVSLDRSLELFAEGKRLAEFCQSQLAEAEEKIKTLIKTSTGFEERPGLRGSETKDRG